MFIESLYKIKREITDDMKHSFIAQTEAYQVNREEWMDRVITTEKKNNRKDFLKSLRTIQTHLTQPGYLSLDVRVPGICLAREITSFLNDLEINEENNKRISKSSSAYPNRQSSRVGETLQRGGRSKSEYILLLARVINSQSSRVGETLQRGGRSKSEYILLLARVALFLQESKISITKTHPTLDQIQLLASLMSELAQRCSPPSTHKKRTRVWDLTLIDNNILRPLWMNVIPNPSTFVDALKEWDPRDYQNLIAPFNLASFPEPSLVGYPTPEIRLSRITQGRKSGFVDQTGRIHWGMSKEEIRKKLKKETEERIKSRKRKT
jgi:hypothetical protein